MSGSGPAYVFYLAECLEKAAEKAGLSRPLASRLAVATVSGSGRLAQLSDQAVSQLRENVTSEGGTTEAALKILMAEKGLSPLIERAVDEAVKRARELHQ